MKVLYDGALFQFLSVGGMIRYFEEIIARVAARPETSVYLYKRKEPFFFSLQERVKLIEASPPLAGGRVPRLAGKINALKYQWNRWRLKALRADVTHLTFFNDPPVSIPTVLTVHDLVYEKFPELYPRNDIFRRERAAAIRQADHIICDSEHTRHDLIALYDYPASQTSVVYLGTTQLTTGDLASVSAARSGRPARPPFVLYVGAFWPHKNILRLLEAYARWRYRNEVELVCVGANQFWTETERSALERLGIGDRVRILGQIEDVALGRLYREALCFVYPSLYEGFGLPVLEAMAAGGVAVSSNAASLPEVGGDCALYFDPCDIEQMQAAMSRAVELSGEQRQQWVEKGQRWAARFNWAETAEQTFQVYRRLAGE